MGTNKYLTGFLFSLLFFGLFGCNSVFYQPDRIAYYPPKKYHYLYREFSFPSKDGTQLIGWHFPAQKSGKIIPPKGTIIQFHGNAQNISSHYTGLVWLTHNGYNLFTFDYRGYGGSEGVPDREGIYQDSLAALEKAIDIHQREQTSGPIILIGQSLGGAIAMKAFEDFKGRENIQLIILDSTFDSYKNVAFKKLSDNWLTFILSPLAYLFVSNNKAPDKFWSQTKPKVIVIHDQNDPVVPFSSGQRVYKKIKGEKQFWKDKKGRHINMIGSEPSPWSQKLLKAIKAQEET